MATAVVPCVIPVMVGDTTAIAPVKGPAQSPPEGHPGGVGHERFVDDRRLLDVDDLGIILRHVDDLWVGRLDPDVFAFPDVDLLVVIDQHSLGIGLGPDQLDRVIHFLFLKVDRPPQTGGPGDVLRQHLDHSPKWHQRNDRRVPVLHRLGRGLLQIGILEEKLVRLDHIERAGGGWEDLGKQFVRVERDRGHELLELRHRFLDVAGLVRLELWNEGLIGLRGGLRGGRHGGRIRHGGDDLRLRPDGKDQGGGNQQGRNRAEQWN
jgi:hypothetical protein